MATTWAQPSTPLFADELAALGKGSLCSISADALEGTQRTPSRVAAVSLRQASLRWSDSATWGGSVPGEREDVVIPSGMSVLLDTNTPSLSSLTIYGELIFEDKDLALTSDWIMVHGKDALLQIGTEDTPFQSKAVITLTGTDEDENVTGTDALKSGTKFIMAMDGGTLDLHGTSRDKVSWTQLDATANPGDTTITLKEAVDWQPGDQIAIAPTAFDPFEAEDVTITAVNGNQVSFTPALEHEHWGTLQTYEGQTLDQRAEVGLLTRNIVIQGAEDSLASSFGGHGMVMPGGTAHIEGVEFFRMGQLGHAARYPFHWHLLNRLGGEPEHYGVTGDGQYVRNSSIHHSFHRAVVVHGTSGVTIQGNVAYDAFSHLYVASEDGDERNNTLTNNLGILARRPNDADFAFTNPDPRHPPLRSFQNEDEPSIFWMRNANNAFVGNHAAGAIGGNGFFFDLRFAPLEEAKVIDTATVFDRNVAHTFTNRVLDDGRIIRLFNPHMYHHISGYGFATNKEYGGPGFIHFTNSVAYKGMGGAFWLDNDEYVQGAIVADVAATCHCKANVVQSVLSIGTSANSRGDVIYKSNGKEQARRKPTGIGWGFGLGSYFKGFDNTFIDMQDYVYRPMDTLKFKPGNRIFRNRAINSEPRISMRDDKNFGNGILDWDGSLSRTGQPVLISNEPLNGASTALAGSSDFLTAVDAWEEPYVIITSPMDGDQIGSSVTLQFETHNLTKVGSDLQFKAVVDETREIEFSTPVTSLTIDNLSPGWHEITIQGTAKPINKMKFDRIYVRVGEGNQPVPTATATPTMMPGVEPPVETPTPAPSARLELGIVRGDDFISRLVADGMTVYTFDNDPLRQSTCTGECAAAWPPVVVGQTFAVPNPILDDISTITRDDGSTQLTYQNKPLYFYANDEQPGDINGDGVGGVWHIVDLTGMAPVSTPTPAPTSAPGTPPTPTPNADSGSIGYAYYEGNFRQLPDFDALAPVTEGTSDSFSIDPRQRDDNFAFRFTGCVNVPVDGDYTFFTRSDDGTQLFVDGELVVNNDGRHAARERSGSVKLEAGQHPIEVTFFEHKGKEVLDVSWSGPGVMKQTIPGSSLSTSGCETAPEPDEAAISGFLFVDQNGNGEQDEDEPGLAGVTVTLTEMSSGASYTATTDVDGYYVFTGIDELGTYVMSIALPSGYAAVNGSTQQLSVDAMGTVNAPAMGVVGEEANGTIPNTLDNFLHLPLVQK